MACQHPLFKFRVGFTEDGKQDLRWIRNPNQSIEDLRRIYKDDLVPIPCGKCPGCALDYSRQWAVRCVLEAAQYDDNCFITLTYDDDHVPEKCSKRDFQLFVKRLRKEFESREIRYFGCGERGSKNSRPHYHLIVFNLDFYDKKPISKDLYTSATLEKLWPFGISSVGSVSMKSCAYVARYSSKKFSHSNFKDEFLLMSKMPGIGKQYYLDHQNVLLMSDFIYGSFGDYSHRARMPRIYEKWLEKDGVVLDDLKQRRIARANQIIQHGMTLRQFNHEEQINKYNLLDTLNKMIYLRRNL